MARVYIHSNSLGCQGPGQWKRWAVVVFPAPLSEDFVSASLEGWGFPAVTVVIHLQGRRRVRSGFGPWVGKIPWRRKEHPTPVFLPGKPPWTEEPGGLQSTGSQRVRPGNQTAAAVAEAIAIYYYYYQPIHF